MSEKDQREAAQSLTEAFGEPYRQVMQTAVDAQQRNVQLAQGWVEGLTGVLESQAEANRALTRAMESYVGVVERTTALQEKTTDLVQGFFGDVTSELREGMQNSQTMAKNLMDGSEKQMEAFQRMLGEAMDTYMNLLNAPLSLYQKNIEALGRKSE